MYNRTHEQGNDARFIQGELHMTTTTTTKNYTKEQEAQMMADYSLEPTRTTVSELATALGKPEKSIIAKLVTLGVYVKATKVTKAGKPVTNKGDLVARINEHFGFDMPSLVKATKVDLENLANNLN